MDTAGRPSSFIEVRHEPDGLVDVGLLRVIGHTPDFAGRASAYFNDTDVTAFARRLTEYPLPQDATAAISGGESDFEGRNYVELVGLRVQATGPLGHIAIRVHLVRRDPTRADADDEVRLGFLTGYERLRVFSQDLERVIKGDLDVALLEGEQ